jgi:hypothetical protein
VSFLDPWAYRPLRYCAIWRNLRACLLYLS